MRAHEAHHCAHRATTDGLATGRLAEPERAPAERHLARCESCRAAFRHVTADRFPKIRSYTILAEVGRGGFGIVYKALHHSKGRAEAVKVLFGKTARRAAYFENEVRLVAKLRHPNIATLFEAHLTRPPLYYTMEFVEGEQLDDYFRSRKVSLEERIEIVKKVAAATDYAHRQGIIHRDLKPQNIIMDPDGEPRILDFGIAKKLILDEDDDGEDGATEGAEPVPRSPEGAVGTYGYIAPEQMAGEPVDFRADIYGLGALLFHVITGQPARFARDVKRLTEVLHERRVSRADDLAAIIACCVHPLPERRYADCAALATDLDNYLAGRSMLARRDAGLGYRIARQAALHLRYRPRLIQAVLIATLAVALSGTFWLTKTRAHAGGTGERQVALIAFTPSTIAALRAGRIGADVPGLDRRNMKSLRLLFGQLMERLAEAEPRIVVWDYYFPDCRPEYDEAFLRGVEALEAPVIVGSATIDQNAEPLLCAEFQAAVHGWGLLCAARLDSFADEFHTMLAARRGFNPLALSLPLAGFAAAQHPDCDVDAALLGQQGLQLRYRRRDVGPGESRWLSEDQTDVIPFQGVEKARPGHPILEPGEAYMPARFRLEGLSDWVQRAIPMEEVLLADTTQLRRWFAGRAVLIGRMIPGSDVHRLQSGPSAHGCQVQAMLLENLLNRNFAHRLAMFDLAWRVLLWCVVAAVLANVVPVSAAWPPRRVSALCALAIVIALVAAAYFPFRTTTPRATEAMVLVCALLAGGGGALLVRTLHQRQLRLTPGVIWAADGTTISSTLLATTDSSVSQHPDAATDGAA